MNYGIKAIETQYKGYRFRSRLEARWAVYFDTIGIKWDYELEGFKLSSGWYLPDFWLRDVNMWAEVKPRSLDDREIKLVRELATMTQRECMLLCGTPDTIPYAAIKSYWKFDDPLLGAVYSFNSYALTKPFCPYYSRDLSLIRTLFPEIFQAVSAARSARF